MEREMIALPLMVVLGVLIAGISFGPGSVVDESGIVSASHPIGRILVTVDRLDGTSDVQYVSNTVTNIAKNQTRDTRLGGGTYGGNTTWVALMLSNGSTAAAATDTACEATVLTANGLAPANGTASVQNGIGNYSVQYKWTATGTQENITKVCLSNHTDTASSLMASAVLSSDVDLVSGENLTITYYITET